MPNSRVPRTLAALLPTLCAAALLAPPAAAKHPLPDLALIHVSDDVATPSYGVQGEKASFAYTYTVKNLGKGTSRATEARLFLVNPRGGRVLVTGGDIPKLKPGKKFANLWEDDLKPLRLTHGAYKAEVCIYAKFREYHRRTSNNCRDVSEPYYVIRRSWTGTADGTAAIQQNELTLNEAWQAAAVTYTFGGAYTKPGKFTYTLSPGSENYQISGGGGGCSAAGGGTVPTESGELKLDYAKGSYEISGNVKNPSQVPYVITCPDTGSTPTFTFAVASFVSNGSVAPALAFGQTELKGTRHVESFGVTYDWNWSLR